MTMAIVTIEIGDAQVDLDLHIIEVESRGCAVEFDFPDYVEDGTSISRVIDVYRDFYRVAWLELAEEKLREECFQALRRQCPEVL
jgi:hypothetical protein